MGTGCSEQEDETSIETFIGRYEEKRTLGRPRSRWEDNTEMHVRKIVW
jgi:hypothetical protein